MWRFDLLRGAGVGFGAALIAATLGGCDVKPVVRDALRPLFAEGERPPPPPDSILAWRARAGEIDAKLPDAPSLRGEGDRPEGPARWQAWFDRGAVAVVLETVDARGRGSAAARYYFVDGALRYYSGSGKSRVRTRGGAEREVDVRREILFDAEGDFVQAVHTRDGLPEAMSLAAIEAIRRRAEEVRIRAAGQSDQLFASPRRRPGGDDDPAAARPWRASLEIRRRGGTP